MSTLRVRYQTIEFGDVDIHVRTLRDKQQFQDDEGEAQKLGISSANWSLFGVIWPSSMILAHLMIDFEIMGKRVLEVGCGIGLSSLVLNHRQVNITSTDYHPAAENFLNENVALNNDKIIPFVRTDWANTETGLGRFDLVIGSDILYEYDHIELLSAFIHQHTNVTSEVIIVDPDRGYHARFTKNMISRGYRHSQHRPQNTERYLDKQFKGHVLHYLR
jgi:predicted nicotinamide N-methyase